MWILVLLFIHKIGEALCQSVWCFAVHCIVQFASVGTVQYSIVPHSAKLDPPARPSNVQPRQHDLDVHLPLQGADPRSIIALVALAAAKY